MPIGEGASLGNAQGRISINTADLNRVAVTSQQVGRQVEQNLGRIGVGAKKAQDSLGGLAGAFGLSLGAAGAVQFGRFALEADALATSFSRQSVAAVSLAGSQEQVNALMRSYDKVTGGAIDKATALSNVTRLLAVGFADNTEELERFVRISRGISVAMGSSQEYIIGQLQLALANQTTARLDQLGVGVQEFQTRLDSLKKSTKGLSAEMLFQKALLDLADEKFGDLADSAEAAATGAEHAAKAWKDAQLAWGELTGGPVGFAGDAVANWMERATKDANMLKTAVIDLGQAFGLLPRSWPSSWNNMGVPDPGFSRSANYGNRTSPGPGVSGPRFDADQTAAMVNFHAANLELDRSSHAERVSANRDYHRAVGDTERDYQQNMGREAQDFARSRVRAEADHLDSILEIRQDAARREADQAEDLARTINRSQADSAERISDARKDAGERLVEMEEDFAKNRERAAEDHRDKMLSAAGRLDAIALLEERKRWAREATDAKEAHDEQRDDLQEQLAERIDDENESLAKSIANAQEAHDRQLADAREADEERIEDMIADFEERKLIEDEDRALRLARMAEDHADQMAEMARQHQLDIEQIKEQEAAERAQLQEDFQKEMDALNIQTERRKKELEQQEKDAEKYFDKWWEHVNRTFSAPLPSGGGGGRFNVPSMIAPGDAPLYTSSVGGGTYKTVNANITINGDGLNEQEVGEKVVDTLIEWLENQ